MCSISWKRFWNTWMIRIILFWKIFCPGQKNFQQRSVKLKYRWLQSSRLKMSRYSLFCVYDDKERKILKKLATNKQTIFLIILAVIFSPAVIGIRYCLFKIGKLEDKKFKIMIESIGFVLFALYFRSLKDTVAYMLIFVIFISYIIYRYYLLSLERSND